MSKPPNDYEKIKAVWYKKLEEEGFKDIEQSEDRLKFWSAHFSRDRTLLGMPETEAYYQYATKFLNDFKFETKLDSIIWEYHANGLSTREIAAELKKVGVLKTGRKPVWLKIQHLKECMKRMYLLGYK